MTTAAPRSPLTAEVCLAALDEALRPRHRNVNDRFQVGAIDAIDTARRLAATAAAEHESPHRRLAALDAVLRPWAAEGPWEIDTSEAAAGYEGVRREVRHILNGDQKAVRRVLTGARDRAEETLRAAGPARSSLPAEPDDDEFREALRELLSSAARGVLTGDEGALLRAHVADLMRDRDQLAAAVSALFRKAVPPPKG
ncbi:hypothetical protein AB0I22_38995 [Streptomyces sp. NPDC050610]|uniref:hypothetical protein n=1 Tax=Streptomyces sp. NPDC050610 TaxID=3157097 RepID=UPI00343782F4